MQLWKDCLSASDWFYIFKRLYDRWFLLYTEIEQEPRTSRAPNSLPSLISAYSTTFSCLPHPHPTHKAAPMTPSKGSFVQSYRGSCSNARILLMAKTSHLIVNNVLFSPLRNVTGKPNVPLSRHRAEGMHVAKTGLGALLPPCLPLTCPPQPISVSPRAPDRRLRRCFLSHQLWETGRLRP